MNPECFQMKHRFSGDSLTLIAFRDHDDFLDVLDYTLGQSFADRPEMLQEAKKSFIIIWWNLLQERGMKSIMIQNFIKKQWMSVREERIIIYSY